MRTTPTHASGLRHGRDERRERSFWGWGHADRFPDDETRRGLARYAEALLGWSGLEPLPAPVFEALSIAPPRFEVPAALAGFVSDDRRARIEHAHGRAFPDIVRGFRGDFRAAPDAVAFPSSEDDLERLFEWAAAARVALIPYGGGTSVVGGVDASLPSGAYAGVVTVDLRALDRVLEIDEVSRAARIQAGASGPILEAQLAAQGLSLRHFPQSFEFSTLGGWIATRAGGHFATLHTHVDDLVESIRMLTPRGVWQTRRLPASGAGPAPDRIVLGSEGILGVVTEAWMRVQPRPRGRASASVFFDRLEAAVDATRAIAQAGLHPTNCRLLEAAEAAIHRVETGGRHVLLLAFESADEPRAPWIERAVAIARAHGGEVPQGIALRDDAAQGTRDEGAATAWRSAFLDAPYLQTVMVGFGVVVDTFETACTWDRWPALHEQVVDAVLRASGGDGRVTFRFTHVYPDGPAPYFTFFARAAGEDPIARWTEIKRAACDAVIAAGGTITHHHAVGRIHRPWYERERPTPFAEALRAMKRALDPAAILNPGVLIDP
jgi:alkyldihydroxyacetonephosphate synthase